MANKKSPLSHAKMVLLNKITRASKAKSPVKLAWETFDANRGKTRKDSIDAAIAKGVAFYTARTQYQAWKQAGDRDAASAAKSQAMMDRIFNTKQK